MAGGNRVFEVGRVLAHLISILSTRPAVVHLELAQKRKSGSFSGNGYACWPARCAHLPPGRAAWGGCPRHLMSHPRPVVDAAVVVSAWVPLSLAGDCPVRFPIHRGPVGAAVPLRMACVGLRGLVAIILPSATDAAWRATSSGTGTTRITHRDGSPG